MYCNTCEKEIPEDSTFCPECGERVTEEGNTIDSTNHSSEQINADCHAEGQNDSFGENKQAVYSESKTTQCEHDFSRKQDVRKIVKRHERIIDIGLIIQICLSIDMLLPLWFYIEERSEGIMVLLLWIIICLFLASIEIHVWAKVPEICAQNGYSFENVFEPAYKKQKVSTENMLNNRLRL